MKIQSAEYIMSEVDIEKFPKDGLFEIVLIGKSNVGKSSFINSMLNRKSLARTSSKPGKTRTANFYLINRSFYFVDMPGYGYAKVSKDLKRSFSKIIENYLAKRETDFVVFFLIDFRHLPTENDIAMFELIKGFGIRPVLILTKSDKVKESQKVKNKKEILNAFGLDDEAVFTYSITHLKEKAIIWAFIAEMIN